MANSTPQDTSKLTKDELVQRLTAADQTITEMQARQKQIDADEKLIAEKMTRGLNRNQAIAVIERQRKFDQAQPGPMAPGAAKEKPTTN